LSDQHLVDAFAEALVGYYGADAVLVVERQVALAEGVSLATWTAILDWLRDRG
jgi:hypothetical protein